MATPKLLSLDAVAEMFPGRSVRWVKDALVRPRRVDHIKVGAQTYIVAASLDAFLRAQTVKGFTR